MKRGCTVTILEIFGKSWRTCLKGAPKIIDRQVQKKICHSLRKSLFIKYIIGFVWSNHWYLHNSRIWLFINCHVFYFAILSQLFAFANPTIWSIISRVLWNCFQVRQLFQTQLQTFMFHCSWVLSVLLKLRQRCGRCSFSWQEWSIWILMPWYFIIFLYFFK